MTKKFEQACDRVGIDGPPTHLAPHVAVVGVVAPKVPGAFQQAGPPAGLDGTHGCPHVRQVAGQGQPEVEGAVELEGAHAAGVRGAFEVGQQKRSMGQCLQMELKCGVHAGHNGGRYQHRHIVHARGQEGEKGVGLTRKMKQVVFVDCAHRNSARASSCILARPSSCTARHATHALRSSEAVCMKMATVVFSRRYLCSWVLACHELQGCQGC